MLGASVADIKRLMAESIRLRAAQNQASAQMTVVLSEVVALITYAAKFGKERQLMLANETINAVSQQTFAYVEQVRKITVKMQYDIERMEQP